MSNNVVVRDALGALVTMRTAESGGIHTPFQIVGSVDKKFRDSFSGAAVDSSKWETVVGSGCTASVSGGALTLTSGTTANASVTLVSKEYFTVPFRLSFHAMLSQRIANNWFIVEVISVNSDTLEPDGLHCASWVFDGTTATNAKYRVKNGGLANLDSAAVTVATTASPGSLYEIEPFADETWFHSGVIDSIAGRSTSHRRHQQIPDPNALYKIRITLANGSTAPASSTTATMQFVAVQDYQELTAEITAGRGQVAAGQAIGVAVTSMPATVVYLSPNASYGSSSFYHEVCEASTNGTLVKNSACNLNDIVVSNAAASARFLKIYNKATAPTVGTDVPIRTVRIPADTTLSLNFGTFGIRLSTGLAFAVTAGMADTDATAVGANEVIVDMSYT